MSILKTLIILSLLLISGCSNLTSRYNPQGERDQPHLSENRFVVIHKEYKSPPISRYRLNQLLNMAMYYGPYYLYGIEPIRSINFTSELPPATFPHWAHRIRYKCNVCHLELGFSLFTGGTLITRGDNLAGRYCGRCHNGETSFTVKTTGERTCERCHIRDLGLLKGDFDTLMAKMPRRKYGDTVDWNLALTKGLIAPVDTIQGIEYPSLPLPERLKKPFAWYTRNRRVTVVFSHVKHVQWMDCAICHPEIFEIKRAGTVEFDKQKMLYGMFCGRCHMHTAFPMNNCSRCHPGVLDR